MNPAPQLPGHPLLGNLLQTRGPLLPFFESAARCGDICRLRYARIIAYLLVRPEHIKHVLVDNYKNYGKQLVYLTIHDAVLTALRDDRPLKKKVYCVSLCII